MSFGSRGRASFGEVHIREQCQFSIPQHSQWTEVSLFLSWLIHSHRKDEAKSKKMEERNTITCKLFFHFFSKEFFEGDANADWICGVEEVGRGEIVALISLQLADFSLANFPPSFIIKIMGFATSGIKDRQTERKGKESSKTFNSFWIFSFCKLLYKREFWMKILIWF